MALGDGVSGISGFKTGGIGIIPGREGPTTKFIKKAITGGKVDRGINVPAFNFRTGDIGGLGAFRDLFINNLAFDPSLDLSSYRSAGGILQERRGVIGEAANIVLSSLDRLELIEGAAGLRSLKRQAGTVTGSHNAEFGNLQSLWTGLLEGESLVQQALSGMSESDRASFNKERDVSIGKVLLPRYKRQIQGEIDVIEDSLPKEESGFYRPGSINVNDILSGDFAVRDKAIAAIKSAGNYALIRDKVEHLPTMLDRISGFKGLPEGIGGLTEGPTEPGSSSLTEGPTEPVDKGIGKDALKKAAFSAARQFLRFPRPRTPKLEFPQQAFGSSTFIPQTFVPGVPPTGRVNISDLEKHADLIIPSGFTSKQPTTQSRALALDAIT